MFSGPESAGKLPAQGKKCFGSRDRKVKKITPFIQMLLALIVVGVLLWLVNRFIPMAGSIKSLLNGTRGDCYGVVVPECIWTI
jgi:hypothetical protein